MSEKNWPLDVVRFAPKEWSLDKIRFLKEQLPTLQKVYPFLKGFSFFGSRVLGKDDLDSDLDTIVYFNADEVPIEDVEDKTDEEIKTYMQAVMEDLEGTVRDDLNLLGLRDSTVLVFDISNYSVKGFLGAFMEALDDGEINEKPEGILADDSPESDVSILALRAVSPFLLSTGKEVYHVRKLILDTLEDSSKGSKYFKILMNYLQYFERGKQGGGKIPNLPKTIAEAREYFFLDSK